MKNPNKVFKSLVDNDKWVQFLQDIKQLSHEELYKQFTDNELQDILKVEQLDILAKRLSKIKFKDIAKDYNVTDTAIKQRYNLCIQKLTKALYLKLNGEG